MSDGKVVFDVVADDSKAVPQVEKAGEKMGAAAKKAGAAVSATAKATAAGAAAIGASFVAASGFAVNAATNMDKALNQLQAATGLADDEMEDYRSTLESIYANNFGESFEDVAQKMGLIKQQLGDISQTDLQTLTEGLYTLEDTFDADFNETLRGTDQLMTQWGLSAEEALDLMAAGSQAGLDYTQELGDNIAEYAGKFAQAGYSAEEYFQLLKNGSEGGAYNLDKVNDAINEVTTRLADGTIEEALGSFNKQTQDTFRAWQDGEATQKQVIDSIVSNIKDCTSEQEALTLASTAFGTMGEDANRQFIESLSSVGDEFSDVTGKMEEMKDVKYDDLSSQMEGLKRTAELLAAPLGEMLIPALAEFGEAVSPLLSSLSDEVGPMLESLVESLPGLFDQLNEAMSPIVETATSLLVPAIDQVLGLLQSLSGPAAELYELFSEIASVAVELAAEALGPLAEILLDLLDPLLQLVGGILGPLTDLFIGLLDPLKDLIVDALNPVYILLDTLLDPLESLLSSILPPLQDLFSGMIPILQGLLGALQPIFDLLSLLAELISSVVSPTLSFLAELFSGLFATSIGAALGYLGSFQSVLSGLMDFITGAFTGDWEKAWSGIVSVFRGVFNTVPTAIESAINGAISVINGLISGVNAITGVIGISAIPKIGRVSLPKFHSGGIADFEAGEGLAMLKDGEMVLTQGQQAALFAELSGSGGSLKQPAPSETQKMVVVVRAEPREMAHAITPYIEEEQRRTDTWE